MLSIIEIIWQKLNIILLLFFKHFATIH